MRINQQSPVLVPKVFGAALFLLLFTGINAQQKEFEGVVEYKVEVKSSNRNISDESLAHIFSMGPTDKSYIKNGNYIRESSLCKTYYLNDKQRVYMKFPRLDTLYYLNYDADTTTLLSVEKSGKRQTILGYACEQITLTTPGISYSYYYAPSLHIDPSHDANNTISHYADYIKEAKGIYLWAESKAEIGKFTSTATNVRAEALDDKIFELPALPETKFDIDRFIKPASFKSPEAWVKYLQKNLNAKLANDYLRIPKGQSSVAQTVLVGFVVKTNGDIADVRVLNPKEVHRVLGAEAVRVISESKDWKPATIFGTRIDYWFTQPITFLSER